MTFGSSGLRKGGCPSGGMRASVGNLGLTISDGMNIRASVVDVDLAASADLGLDDCVYSVVAEWEPVGRRAWETSSIYGYVDYSEGVGPPLG